MSSSSSTRNPGEKAAKPLKPRSRSAPEEGPSKTGSGRSRAHSAVSAASSSASAASAATAESNVRSTHSSATAPSALALSMHTDDLSSDDEAPGNTIGNVPRKWYDDYDHVGYDLAGQRIGKPVRKDGIDRFLSSQDDPNFKWTVFDDETGEEIVLSKRDVQLIQRIRAGTVAHPEADMYPDAIEIFCDTVEPHPLNDPVEPKRRFLPSKWEKMKVYRIVKAIKEGRMARAEPKKQLPSDSYLLWGDDDAAIGFEAKKKAPPAIPAPKMSLPGHAASYNPPPEYLLTPEEAAAWEAADPADRPLDFLPRKYDSLRRVPLYAPGVRERFERCLDLYLCPRLTRNKSEVDPSAMLPKLPDPSQLRPFPNSQAFTFDGHTSRVRSISVDPTGVWLVSGSDDCTVRLWSISSGRCERTWHLGGTVRCVAWCPNPAVQLVAAVTGSSLVFLYPGTCVTEESAEATFAALSASRGGAAAAGAEAGEDGAEPASVKPRRAARPTVSADGEEIDPEAKAEGEEGDSEEEEEDGGGEGRKGSAAAKTGAAASKGCTWEVTDGSVPSAAALLPGGSSPSASAAGPVPQLASAGVRLTVAHPGHLSQVVWHRGGDYLATVAPQAAQGSAPPVFIHQLSRRASTAPLGGSGSTGSGVQCVAFHPSKPLLYVASQRSVRVFHLVKEELVMKLEAGVKWISSLAVHPSGNHLLLGSYDHRVVWFDTDLSTKPYRTLKYHTKAVRHAAFHSGKFPLMATASDDGTVHVFHARVFSDFAQNPLIVPVKILRAHAVTADDLGTLDVAFHPLQPWLFTAGADGIIKLWTDV